MPDHKILILGGTAEARELAGLCADTLPKDTTVITSLAGRTKSAASLPGAVRVGGFGGVDGLVEYLTAENISAIVDATHPFAQQISSHGAAAAKTTDIPHLMIRRPGWDLPADLKITHIPTLGDAPGILENLQARAVLVTTGTQGLDAFASVKDARFVIRKIEDHAGPPPFDRAEIIVQRPPYTVENERRLMTQHSIDFLLTKESGGAATEAKLQAAQELDVHVVMVSRPPLPEGNSVATPEEALGWLQETLKC